MSEEIKGNTRKNSEKKDSYFIEKSVTNSVHTENSSKVLKNPKTKETSQNWRKQKIRNTSRINPFTLHTNPKNYLVKGQLAVHGSQLKLQLANLTVQATNRGKHSVLLFPVIQENVVTPQIHHISLQMLDADLEVRLLMLKPRPLNKRFLVLFQVLTAPKPPVTNYRKSVTFKTQNRTKKPQIHWRESKNISQKSYRRHPTSKKTDNY